MYCGNCLRDNALVRELRSLGHDTLMVPLYLPMTLDEADESAGTPTFFGASVSTWSNIRRCSVAHRAGSTRCSGRRRC